MVHWLRQTVLGSWGQAVKFEESPRVRARHNKQKTVDIDRVESELPQHQTFAVQRTGSVLIATPQGDSARYLFRNVQHELDNILAVLVERGPLQLIVDFGKSAFLGSTSIGMIVTMSRTAGEAGGRAFFCNAGPQIHSVLDTMRLLDRWPYFATREDALREATVSPPEAGS
jgi:anti-anti-sigma regulatory factor